MMEERRKTNRRFLIYYARVFDAENGDLVGHLGDLTADGAMLISEMPIPVGTKYNFRLELSVDVSEREYLDFSAVSIWAGPDLDPDYYNTGFELIDVPAVEEAIIRRIVNSYGIRDS